MRRSVLFGVVGLGLFVCVIGASVLVSLAGLRQLVASNDRATETIARGVIVGVLGLFVAYVFLSGQYEKQLWLLLGLLIAIPTVAASAHQTREQSMQSRRIEMAPDFPDLP